MPRPIAIDLFAGAGGFSLGLEQAGFNVVAAAEHDPIHAAIHELNFPHTAVLCHDVRQLSGSQIRSAADLRDRTIDLVAGGPPCQGFSLIGNRVLEDPRNELIHHFFRIVSELRPRAFIMENVPGIVTGEHKDLLDTVVEEFERIKYNVRTPYRVLRASNYGVPQERNRLFLIGALEGETCPEYPEQTTQIDSPMDWLETGTTLCPTVADAIGDLPDIDRWDRLFKSDTLEIDLPIGSPYAMMLREKSYAYAYPRSGSGLTGCGRTQHNEETRVRFTATLPGATEPISRFFRLANDGLCNTLRAGTASDHGAFTAPRPIHPIYPRCISVREGARLHSYPDWFRFHKTIAHGFRQIGNSVPPLLGYAVGSAIAKALHVDLERPEIQHELGLDDLAEFTMQGAERYFGLSHHAVAPRRRGV